MDITEREFNEMMRRQWALSPQRPRHPGALNLNDLKPGMRIVRVHPDVEIPYKVDSAPFKVREPVHRGYFIGGEDDYHIWVIQDMSALRGKLPRAMLVPRREEMSLRNLGILPHNTVEGPMYQTDIYAIEEC
jgi:hypothetical protein